MHQGFLRIWFVVGVIYTGVMYGLGLGGEKKEEMEFIDSKEEELMEQYYKNEKRGVFKGLGADVLRQYDIPESKTVVDGTYYLKHGDIVEYYHRDERGGVYALTLSGIRSKLAAERKVVNDENLMKMLGSS